MSDERQSFVDSLALDIEAHGRWASNVDSADDGKRIRARIEQRSIEQRLSDMLACNPIEVARMLVTMWRALEREELLHRTESRLDHLDQRLEYLTERIDNAGMV